MGLARTIGAVMLLAVAVPVAAQESIPALPSRPIASVAPPILDPPETSVQLLAAERWTHDYAEWKAWYQQWRNRVEPGWLSSRARRPAPEPPAWLPAACASVLEDEAPLADACQAWREWRLDDATATLITQQVAQVRTNSEAPHKTLWWERVHVDALWPMTQSGTRGFGVAGVHATMQVSKRVQVFVAPGAILMRLPSLDGTQQWTAATDWGFSFSLFEFRFPGMRRPSTAHFNIARVWILGQQTARVPGELYLAGLSFTFKPR
jgi:hypothetical protein